MAAAASLRLASLFYAQVMNPRLPDEIPTLLFGAFDRHNFGDLLFAHIAATLLDGRPLLFAGLLARDLRAHGGSGECA